VLFVWSPAQTNCKCVYLNIYSVYNPSVLFFSSQDEGSSVVMIEHFEKILPQLVRIVLK